MLDKENIIFTMTFEMVRPPNSKTISILFEISIRFYIHLHQFINFHPRIIPLHYQLHNLQHQQQTPPAIISRC